MASPRGLKDLISGFQQAGGTDAILKAIERKRQEGEFSNLINALQNQKQTQTVNETQQLNNPLAQGITNPLMNAASQAFNPVKDITTQREVPLSPQELQRAIMEKVGQYYGQGGNNPMAGSLAQTYMPKQPENVTLGEGAIYGQVENGKFNKIAENLKDFPPQKPENQKDVVIDYETLKDERTGKAIRYKIVSDKLTGQTLSKEPQGEADKVEGITLNNYAGDRLEFDKEKEIAKQKEKDAKGQGTYDAIMDSWDNEAKAYVVNKGSKDEQKFKTDEEVQRFAQKIIESEGYMNVRKWKHAKGGQTPKTGKQSSNYIGGKIYVDANGNKAKHVNGEFIEVK